MKRELFKNKYSVIFTVVAIITVVLFISCQAVFTFSPFQFLQRDPSKLPDEQKEAYARNALASGDSEQMAEAYEAINQMLQDNPNDPDLNLLAADLASGASGLNSMISSLDVEGGLDSLNEALESLNPEMLASIPVHVTVAENNDGNVSQSQYINAGVAIIANEAIEAGGFDKVDWESSSEELEQAKDFAEKGGVDLESYFG
ncbi:MAG: hypothetical protein DRP87_01040 [Spirochaetes bacterium]|mgnify:CR=1 FL=1|nr:MAG: hypothetical protein DRP87_01040 [Spirochaetota bacterium]